MSQPSNALPAVGTPAPDPTLPSTSGADVTLSSLRGKNVLLAFFPRAFTRVCTQEMCAVSEDYGRFRDASTEVLRISVDPIPTLRDLMATGEVSRRYGTLIEETFVSNRAYVVMGPDGVVLWANSEDTLATRRENEELLAQVLETHQRSA